MEPHKLPRTRMPAHDPRPNKVGYVGRSVGVGVLTVLGPTKTRLNTSVEREGRPGCGVSNSLAGGGPSVICEGFGGRPLLLLSFLAPQTRQLWGAAEKKKKRDPKTGFDLARFFSPTMLGSCSVRGDAGDGVRASGPWRFEGSGPMCGRPCKFRLLYGQLEDFTSQE